MTEAQEKRLAVLFENIKSLIEDIEEDAHNLGHEAGYDAGYQDKEDEML